MNKIRLMFVICFCLIIRNSYSLNATNYTTSDGLLSNNVTGVSVAKNGNVWFCSDSGVFMFDGVDWEFWNQDGGISSSKIKTINIDADDNVWILSDTGLSKFKNNTWSNIPFTINEDYLNYMAIDKEGSIWLATDSKIISWQQNDYLEIPIDFIGSHVSITNDNSFNIYVGSKNSEISIYEGNNWKKISSFDGFGSSVSYITKDYIGNIWYADNFMDSETSCSIQKRINDSTTVYYDEDDGAIQGVVKKIIVDKNNRLYFATQNGLGVYDNEKWSVFTIDDGLMSNNISSVAIDSNNNLWITSDSGISKITELTAVSYDINCQKLFGNKLVKIEKRNSRINFRCSFQLLNDTELFLYALNGKEVASTSCKIIKDNNSFFLPRKEIAKGTYLGLLKKRNNKNVVFKFIIP